MLSVTPAQAGEQSRFLDQLEALSYPAAEHPGGAVGLHWDLSRGMQHGYDYREQGFNSRIVRGQRQDSLELVSQKVATRGKVILQSTFDKKARLSLDQIINLETLQPDGGIDKQSGLKGSYVIEDISATGIFATRKPIDLHFQSLMRLPDRDMKAGDSVTIPVGLTREMEFGNITLKFAGDMVINLAGFARCNDHLCAELHTRTQITEAALPDGAAGEVRMHYDGRGRSWFDLEDSKLVESMRITILEIDTETPADNPDTRAANNTGTVHVLTRYDTLVHLKHSGSGPSLDRKLTIKKYRRAVQPQRD